MRAKAVKKLRKWFDRANDDILSFRRLKRAYTRGEVYWNEKEENKQEATSQAPKEKPWDNNNNWITFEKKAKALAFRRRLGEHKTWNKYMEARSGGF